MPMELRFGPVAVLRVAACLLPLQSVRNMMQDDTPEDIVRSFDKFIGMWTGVIYNQHQNTNSGMETFITAMGEVMCDPSLEDQQYVWLVMYALGDDLGFYSGERGELSDEGVTVRHYFAGRTFLQGLPMSDLETPEEMRKRLLCQLKDTKVAKKAAKLIWSMWMAIDGTQGDIREAMDAFPPAYTRKFEPSERKFRILWQINSSEAALRAARPVQP